MTFDSALSTLTGWLKGLVSLGLALAVVFLVVDVLFPETTNIVGNVADLVNSFTSEGLTGLIILIALVAVAFGDD